MLFYELIDFENPICLYCKSDVKFSYDTELMKWTQIRFEMKHIRCLFCNEEFTINYNTDLKTEKVLEYDFIFSCNGIKVRYLYKKNQFFILSEHTSTMIPIPEFDLDFSDKNKLFQKLSTYILFS